MRESEQNIDLSEVMLPPERADKPDSFSHTGTKMAAALTEGIEAFVPDGRTWHERRGGYGTQVKEAVRINGWRTYEEVMK